MPGYHRMRLPDAYRAMATLSARGLAWEWLRRNPGFRAISCATAPPAQRACAHAKALLRSRRPVVDLPQHVLARRSEEPTTELQSLMRISYAVFCLKTKNSEPIPRPD